MKVQPPNLFEALQSLWHSMPACERAALGIHTRQYWSRRDQMSMIELRWKVPAAGKEGKLGDVHECEYIAAASTLLQLLADLRSAERRRHDSERSSDQMGQPCAAKSAA